MPYERSNVVEEVNSDLEECGVQLQYNVLFEWTLKGFSISVNDLANKLWCHRESAGKERIALKHIQTALSELEVRRKADILQELKLKIAYEPGRADKFEELAQMMSRDNYEPMYPVILRHVVWTVKRRVFGLPDYCPIFLNLYGAAGSGKSETVRAMFSILPASRRSTVCNAADLINDERQTFRLVENFVITLDEIAGMDKADVNKFKNLIDQPKIVYRQLGFNKTSEGRNNAQLIGTSNTRLRNTLIASSDVRKWCEIDFYSYPDNEVPEKMVKPMHAFDWVTLWKSVDENADSPFHDADTYNAFKAWTSSKCTTETPTNEFIWDYIAKHGGNFMSWDSLWNSYKSTFKENNDKAMMQGTFRETITKHGFRAHRTRTTRGYIVPKAKDEDTEIWITEN